MTTPNKNQYGTQGTTQSPQKSQDVKSGVRKDEPASQTRSSGMKGEALSDRKSY